MNSPRWVVYVSAFSVLFAVAAVWAFRVPPALGFQAPDAARIIFFHVPFAVLSNVGLIAATVFGVRYLNARNGADGARLVATWEIATLLAAIGLATGIPFSRVQWGAWWHWDPRQTSFLIVTLLLLAGLALRGGFKERDKQRAALAGYALLTVIPNVFLTFVYPRLESVKAQSLHPSTTIANGGLDADYRLGLYLMGFAVLAYGLMAIHLRIRLERLEEALEQNHGNLETNRNGAASGGGNRPVVVSKKS